MLIYLLFMWSWDIRRTICIVGGQLAASLQRAEMNLDNKILHAWTQIKESREYINKLSTESLTYVSHKEMKSKNGIQFITWLRHLFAHPNTMNFE